MKYETAVPVGRGGIAEVLRAYDPELRRDVALKLLRHDDPILAERMMREAQAQARVEHPNVCPVYETGTTDDGQLYIAMQYIDGPTLDVAAREMNLEEKVRVLREVSLAMQAAHAAGLIHRDLKPANILVERQDDGHLKPWVVDFGIARQHDAPGMTMTGQVMGTPAYMPPEQARGERDQVDRRSDVYALGAVLYHILSGKPPFTGDSTVAVLVKILQSDPEPLRRLVPSLPPDLETITMKCLEKNPDRRYRSARALAEDLERFLEGGAIAARPVSLWARLRRRARRHKAVTILAALIAVGLPTGLIKYTFDLDRERRHAVAAKSEAEDLMDFMLRDLYDRLQALGRVDLLSEVARKSLQHYEDRDLGKGWDVSSGQAPDTGTWHRRALALRNVGLVLESEGDLESALVSLLRSREIVQKLREREPENLDWSLQLATGERMVGQVLQEQGNIDEAMRCYQASLALAEDLAARDAARDDWREAVWHGRTNVGWLLLESGELDKALELFESALPLMRQLSESHPDQGELRDYLSSNLAYIGFARQDQGQLPDALASFEQALEEALELARSNPTNIRWQYGVSLSQGRVAFTRQELGDLEGAAEAYRESLEINERLVADDPSNARWTRELAVNYSGLGAVQRRQGQLDSAGENMEKSLALSRRLARQDASNTSLKNDLAWDLIQLGMIHQAQSHSRQAQTAWEEALGVITPVVEITDVPYYRDTQVMALLNLGRVEEARPIVEKLLEGGWDDPEFLELCRQHDLLP